jgi:serralysin
MFNLSEEINANNPSNPNLPVLVDNQSVLSAVLSNQNPTSTTIIPVVIDDFVKSGELNPPFAESPEDFFILPSETSNHPLISETTDQLTGMDETVRADDLLNIPFVQTRSASQVNTPPLPPPPPSIPTFLSPITDDAKIIGKPKENIVRQQRIKLDRNLLTDLEPADTIQLNLFNDRRLVVTIDQIKNSPDQKNLVLIGEITGDKDIETSQVVLISAKDSRKVLGDIRIKSENRPDEVYEIRTTPQGNYTVSQIDAPVAFVECPTCNGFHPPGMHTESTSGIQTRSSTVPLTGNNQIDSLLTKDKWDTSVSNIVTYSFLTTASADSYWLKDYETGVKEPVAEVTEAIKNNVRNILKTYENYINVKFQEVPDTMDSWGAMRYLFVTGDNAPSLAQAYYPSYLPAPWNRPHESSGDVQLSNKWEDDAINRMGGQPGSYGYMTLIHETGHAIGLKHPGNYTGNSATTGIFLPAGEDNTTYTMMTYSGLGGASRSALTPMLYDVQALQYMYGANTRFNAGNNTYSFDSVNSFTDGVRSLGKHTEETKATLWDAGGRDTVDLSGLPAKNTEGTTENYMINMAEGGIITTQSAYNTYEYIAMGDFSGATSTTSAYGTVIAYRTVLENLINSPANDLIYLNSAPNMIRGYAPNRLTGNDQIIGADGDDTLDLSSYTASAISQSQSGQDLMITLGTKGTVKLANYYGVTSDNRPTVKIGVAGTGKPQISINDMSILEGETGTTAGRFVVSLNRKSAAKITVKYATANNTALAGEDYTARTGTVTFLPGETRKVISIPIIGDQKVETDENFWVNLRSPVNAVINDNRARGTIRNNDLLPVLNITGGEVTEGNSLTKNLPFTVNLNKPSTETITVNFSTSNNTATSGEDYVSRTGTLTFLPGQVSKTVGVKINGDRIVENDEYLYLYLDQATNATISNPWGQGKIINDDVNDFPQVSAREVTVTEGNSGTTNAIFAVSLSKASTQNVTMDYQTTDSTALAGSDYQAKSGTITFLPGQLTKNIAVPVIGDAIAEPTEYFLLGLTNAVNANITDNYLWAYATVQDND